MKKTLISLFTVICTVLLLSSCNLSQNVSGMDESDTCFQTSGQSDEEKIYTLVFDGSEYKYTGDSSAIKAEGSSVTLTKAAKYLLSGVLDNGQLVIDAGESGQVYLVFSNLNISCQFSAPVYVKSADKVIIELASGSSNSLTDAKSYSYASEEKTEPNACLFSDCDLTISGSGSLKINGNYNNGIGCQDNLSIKDGDITVSAANNAVKGSRSVMVEDGNLTVDQAVNGIITESIRDSEGFILISGGNFSVTCSGDALKASRSILINGGSAFLAPQNKNYMCQYKNDAGKDICGSVTVNTTEWPAVN